MSVALVMPVFNGARYLRAALESALAQDRRPDRIIVVDDQSTDDSASIAGGIDGVEVISNPEKGGCTARNLGAQHADADYIAVLDQDDLWHPGHLRVVLGALEAQPDAVATFGGIHAFADGETPPLSDQPSGVEPLDAWRRFPTHCPVGTSSAAVIRRDAYARVGGFDQRFQGCGDYVLWLRLAQEGPLLRCAPPTVGKREHPMSQTSALRKDGLRSLELLIDGTADVLARREGDAEPHAGRHAVAAATTRLARAAMNGDGVDASTNGELRALEAPDVDALWDSFRLVGRTLGGPGEARLDVMARLYRAWPKTLDSRRWLLEYCARRHWPAGRFFGSVARLKGREAAFLARLLALKWKRELRPLR